MVDGEGVRTPVDHQPSTSDHQPAMRIAVLGAGGMLGRDLCAVLSEEHEVVPLSRDEADVTDLPALRARLAQSGPDLVINCAAATDVDRCEREPDWAYRANAWGAWSAA